MTPQDDLDMAYAYRVADRQDFVLTRFNISLRSCGIDSLSVHAYRHTLADGLSVLWKISIYHPLLDPMDRCGTLPRFSLILDNYVCDH